MLALKIITKPSSWGISIIDITGNTQAPSITCVPSYSKGNPEPTLITIKIVYLPGLTLSLYILEHSR
jgi:hypothetical protein